MPANDPLGYLQRGRAPAARGPVPRDQLPGLLRRRPQTPQEAEAALQQPATGLQRAIGTAQANFPQMGATTQAGLLNRAEHTGVLPQAMQPPQAAPPPEPAPVPPSPVERSLTKEADEMLRRLAIVRSDPSQRVFDPANPGATPQQVRAMGGRYSPAGVRGQGGVITGQNMSQGGTPFARTGATTGAVYNPLGERMDPAQAQAILDATPKVTPEREAEIRANQRRIAEQRRQSPEYQQEQARAEELREFNMARGATGRQTFGEFRQQRDEQARTREVEDQRMAAAEGQADLQRRGAESEIDLNAARAEQARREPRQIEGASREVTALSELAGSMWFDDLPPDVRAAVTARLKALLEERGASGQQATGGSQQTAGVPSQASKTATNPQTGQTVYLVGGQWVDENGAPVQ